jgi:hypothetical protein
MVNEKKGGSMDRGTNMRLQYDSSNRVDERYARLIFRIAQTRGSTLVLEPGKALALFDNRIRIFSAWPVISYFTERYPEPELLPGDCIQRALIRTLTAELITAGEATGAFAQVRSRNSFIFGTAPSLLDLAYITVTEGDPAWSDLHDRFFAFVLDAAIESCLDEEDLYYDDDDRDLRFIA